MAKFNLVDEKWICVLDASSKTTKEVSLKELFQNAQNYVSIAGDMKTQDFAMLRLLLAVIHTVFSRVDVHGNPHTGVTLDERMKQTRPVELADQEDYQDELYDTWQDLWKMGRFPDIVWQYLEIWKDRFYLLSEKNPFYQVEKDDIHEEKISKSAASSISGKNINRQISESNNKIALFSPKYDNKKNKEIISYSEMARWLITYHAYTGLADKVIFGKEKYKASKGWLFDIGGVYVEGENLFETLMLNTVLVRENYTPIEKPCWEFTSEENIKKSFLSVEVDNVSELYTLWSRAVYINPETSEDKAFSIQVVKLPDINHKDQFTEPMSIWKYNKDGDNKDSYTPKKHRLSEALWRSFGLLAMPSSNEENQKRPGVIDWLYELGIDSKIRNIKLQSVSMQDDGNATSWVPVNEICDSFTLKSAVFLDDGENGWLNRIYGIVEETKGVVNGDYKRFLKDLEEIRGVQNSGFINNELEKMYFNINKPFKEWLYSIEKEDEPSKKTKEWKENLDFLITKEARKFFDNASHRDYKGVINDGKLKNIATIYNSFKYFLDYKLLEKEGE